jgi:hypothetical protein
MFSFSSPEEKASFDAKHKTQLADVESEIVRVRVSVKFNAICSAFSIHVPVSSAFSIRGDNYLQMILCSVPWVEFVHQMPSHLSRDSVLHSSKTKQY